jgi:hypothetical protein
MSIDDKLSVKISPKMLTFYVITDLTVGYEAYAAEIHAARS